jgi:hypothetical protein
LNQLRRRLTYANVMSTIAVFLVLGGAAAYAGSRVPKHSVGPRQLKTNAVTTPKLRRNAVTAQKIRNGAITNAKLGLGAVSATKIGPDAVNGASVADNSLSTADLSDVKPLPRMTLPAAAAAGFERARGAGPAAPPRNPGALSVYAKCFTDSEEGRTWAIAYAASAQPGSLLVSGADALAGGPFLNPATEENDRELAAASATENSAGGAHSAFSVDAPDGTTVTGQLAIFAKNGSLSDGSGPYGPGDACVVSGYEIG